MAEKYGLELFLKSNLQGVLAGAGAAAQVTRGAIAGVGQAAGRSFEVAGAAIVVFNQSLEIAKKAIEVFRATIGDSIAVAMQFRGEGDELTKTFKGYGREVELTKARLGDTLMPVFKGFIDVIGETTGKMSDLIVRNRELIGTKLIEWIGSASKMLVSGLARAAEYVGKIFLGWKAIITVVQMAVSEFFALVTDQLGFFAGAIATVAEKFGASGIGAAVRQAQESVKGLGDEFRRSSQESSDSLVETASNIDQLEKTIESVEKIAREAIAGGMVRSQQELQKSIVGTNTTLEEQRQKTEEARKAAEEHAKAVAAAQTNIDKMSEARIAAIDAAANRFEQDARKVDSSAGGEPSVAGAAGSAALASAGEAGAIVQGFAQGGIAGGIGASVSALLSNSEAFQEALGTVSELIATLAKALDPIMGIVQLIVEVISGGLQPALSVLGKALNKIASIILGIAEGFAKMWNGVVGAIAGVLKKIGRIKIFGKKPLGFLERWGNDFEDRASISMDAFDRARDRLKESSEKIAEGMGEGSEVIEETVQDMKRQLTNVPRVLKVALREFEAAEAESQVRQRDMTPGYGGASVVGGGGSSGATTMPVENVWVTTIANPDEVAKTIEQEGRRNRRQSGAPVLNNGAPMLSLLAPKPSFT